MYTGFIFFLCMTMTTISAESWWEKFTTSVKETAQNVKASFETLETWNLPDKRLRFDEVAYLGAHNAFSSLQEGFLYSQQFWNLDNQLRRGVRHINLDVWRDGDEILLCHGACDSASRWQRIAFTSHRTLQSYLLRIKEFLINNPQEILSIEFESYIENEDMYREFTASGLIELALTPQDYDPKQYEGKWPTLQHLIKKNKRLILFDTGDPSKYAFGTNDYLIRNEYGKLNLDQASEPRKVPAGSRIFQMSYFGTITSPLPGHNTPTQLKKLLYMCQKKNVVSAEKAPNFILLDNVHLGNAMKWVNGLNSLAAQQLK